MNLNVSYNQQQVSPNFGMAVKIKPKAQPFLEMLPMEERQYIRDLGNKIKKSRNHIHIGEGGKVYNSYEPKASEIRIVNPENRAEVDAERKAEAKRLKSMVTKEDRKENLKQDAKTLWNIVKIKLNPRKSKFMKDIQVAEQIQASCDRADAFDGVLRTRLAQRDAAAKADTKKLISQFGEKE